MGSGPLGLNSPMFDGTVWFYPTTAANMKLELVPIMLGIVLTQVNAHAQDTDALLGKSRAIAAQLGQQLGAELKKEMASGGPTGAIAVCGAVAPEIAGRLSREHGVKVARVSLKTRNPMIGLPDNWEQEVLRRFDERAAAGEKPETLEHAEIVSEAQGRFYRYLKAIPVQPLCLACHGGAEVSVETQAALAREYPHDRARGYSLGQVRGAITIKHPVD